MGSEQLMDDSFHPRLFYIGTRRQPFPSVAENFPEREYPHTQLTFTDQSKLCPDCLSPLYYSLPRPPLIVDAGNTWSDFVRAGLITRPWFVSERVAEFLLSEYEGIQIAPIGDIEISPECTTLELKDAPQYYEVVVNNLIPMDIENPSFNPEIVCPVCLRKRTWRTDVKDFYQPQPRFHDWVGDGLARTDVPIGSLVFCTWSIVQTARDQRWTGVDFKASLPTAKEMGFRGSKRFDLFADTWPPSIWYED